LLSIALYVEYKKSVEYKISILYTAETEMQHIQTTFCHVDEKMTLDRKLDQFRSMSAILCDLYLIIF